MGRKTMRRNKMLGLEVMVMVVGLLSMANQSVQMSLKNPVYQVIQKVNQDGPLYGLVLISDPNEQDLMSSNAFTPSHYSPLILGGRKYHVGKINGTGVVYVKTGIGSTNAAAATEKLIDTFDIEGIVHYGSGGGVNNSLLPGDVVSPSQVAFTGAWYWKNLKTAKQGQLKFGDFNYPDPGNNTLGSVSFRNTTYFTPQGKNMTLFWFPLKSSWSALASKELQDIELQQCLNTTACLPRAPRLIFGYNASSSDTYLLNRAYREYLYRKLHVAVVDKEAAAVASVAYANNVPVVVFKGITNTAGATNKYRLYNSLGSKNAMNAAVSFIASVGASTTPAKSSARFSY